MTMNAGNPRLNLTVVRPVDCALEVLPTARPCAMIGTARTHAGSIILTATSAGIETPSMDVGGHVDSVEGAPSTRPSSASTDGAIARMNLSRATIAGSIRQNTAAGGRVASAETAPSTRQSSATTNIATVRQL